ncbi:DUF7550 family protein [Natrinema halophilum]|uniref:Uncharacterized protein n=1 Tax=Natrinema halophilum TaxID=1699371 RepID=A0A7D5KBD8_9EURY|nr:hypothetical protein [Natrinema halophilum]QLG47681.1 hypothetical protein HYG82_01880 [Natrinema halophilum]
MTDETETPDGADTGADVGHDLTAERTTAPMSAYSSRDVLVGGAVAVVGAAIAFGIPLLTVGV